MDFLVSLIIPDFLCENYWRRLMSWAVAIGVVVAWNQWSNRDNGEVVKNEEQAKWNERIVAASDQKPVPRK